MEAPPSSCSAPAATQRGAVRLSSVRSVLHHPPSPAAPPPTKVCLCLPEWSSQVPREPHHIGPPIQGPSLLRVRRSCLKQMNHLRRLDQECRFFLASREPRLSCSTQSRPIRSQTHCAQFAALQ